MPSTERALFILLLWALLSCACRLQAEALLGPMPLPGWPPATSTAKGSKTTRVPASLCLEPDVQLASLCIFFAILNGDDWTDKTGWNTCAELFLSSPNFTDWVSTTGTCNLLDGAIKPISTSMEEALTRQAQQQATAAAATVTLPDACCWPGVICCQLQRCRNSLDNPLTCNCTPGSVVGLQLGDNNLTGDLGDHDGAFSIYEALIWLSCSLRSLQLPNNHLYGSLPDTITTLSELWMLGLGYNNISGTIPSKVSSLTSLRVLELTNNDLEGTVPSDLCGSDNSSLTGSPLTDILVANNALTGRLDLTRCSDLIMLDAANNALSGIIADRGFYPQLHVLLLQNNRIPPDGLYVDLSRARVMTELNLGSNALDGPIPMSISSQFFLTSLVLEHNNFNGSLSQTLFNSLGALSALDLSDNKFVGSIPEGLGQASSLLRLDLSNNSLTGPLPDSLVKFTALNISYLDISNTYMSCCGSNFTLYPNGTGLYAFINWSLPRLPRGLAFSSILQPISDYSDSLTPNDGSNLYCPFIKVDPGFQQPDQQPGNHSGLLLSWFLNPSYTLFEGCQCDRGSVLVNDTDLQLVYCIPSPQTSESLTWVWILVAVLGAALLLALMLWLLFFRGTRPILVQNFLDMRKRLKGAPQGGLVSIVVTDIEGFSDLMKEFPELTTKALLIHNNLIRKAMWTSLGNTIEQEGDSFSVVFHEAHDAVRFCLQTQLLLDDQSWPPGLFDSSSQPPLRKSSSPASWRHKNSNLLKRLYRSSTRSFAPESKQSMVKPRKTTEKAERPASKVQDVSCSGAASPVKGLRVRMGIATGHVPLHSGLASSSVMELAKFVSDAASGGQVLMCSSTFQAVRTMGRELGCVDVNGLNHDRLNSTNAKWMVFWRSKEQQQEEAIFLHMGQYLYCKHGAAAPAMLTPQLLQLDLLTEPYGWKLNSSASVVRHDAKAKLPSSSAQDCVQLFQVLAPSLISRGRFLGSKLSLKEEWVPLDVPYFSAPGALLAPLTPSDFVPSHLGLPLVTMVFCMVDGGKNYASRNRRDAQAVHVQLVALMKSVLRQVPGGYFVKGQDGDLKYMVAFADPKRALLWCLAVQECAMYVDWPASALQQWPEEQDGGKQLLFRGPRLRMGMCEGTPRSILPDYNGRADYLGDSINRAARFMDAAAHGGQVACTTELVLHILATSPGSISRPASIPEPASLHDSACLHPGIPTHAPSCNGALGDGFTEVGGWSSRPLTAASVTHLASRGCEDAGPVAGVVASTPTPDANGKSLLTEQQQKRSSGGLGQQPLASGLPQQAAAASWVAVQLHGEDMPQQQPASHGVSEVVALHLGSFRFKGSDEVVPMAHVTRASLAARRCPSDPPKGKGARLSEARGVLASAHVPLLDIINEYSSRGSIGNLPAAMPLPSSSARFSSLLSPRLTRGSRLQQYSSTQRSGTGGQL